MKVFATVVLCSALSYSALAAEPLRVNLSYDDALESQLANVIPVLNRYQVKGSFYVVPSYDGFTSHQSEWASIAQQGHELGNHSLTHPCQASLPGREWVAADNDLDTMSVEDMLEQVKQANEVLFAVDGKTERSYTPPCGDKLAGGKNYIPALAGLFTGIKWWELDKETETVYMPENSSTQDLIEMLNKVPESTKIVTYIFHGVGGDYIAVSSEAHEGFVKYLVDNKDKYNVDTYTAHRKAMKNH